MLIRIQPPELNKVMLQRYCIGWVLKAVKITQRQAGDSCPELKYLIEGIGVSDVFSQF